MSRDQTLDVHVVSHTHWDREWYLTREQFRLRLVALIDRVLDRLDGDPRFAFHLDGQTIVLEDYLEVRPEQAARLGRRIAEGRLLVGPWYVMPDQFLVSGEALVRNLALGHRIAARFGGAMPVGYIPDPFGHVAQMPQILSHFGLDNAILWRGFGGPRAEYWWEAPDGSRVLLLHLPREGYANGFRLPLLPSGRMREEGAALLGRERERTAFGQALLMVGVDHVEPHPRLPELVACLGEAEGVRARLSTLPAYVDAVRAGARAGGGALETVRGELRTGEEYAYLLPGVLSARAYLKQANARVETILEKWAEPAALFAWLLGGDEASGLLDYAWKTLLQNHPHDSICGCSIDAVHDENMSRFARAEQVAEGVAERALATLAREVEPPPPGTLRCLAVNTDAEAYSGLVEAFVDLALASAGPGHALDPTLQEAPAAFFPPGARVSSLTDADGRAAPFQVLGEEERVVHQMSRFAPPWPLRARRVRMVFRADVPPCGYAAFDVHVCGPAASPPPPPPPALPVSGGEGWIENELLRVELNDDGTLDVLDKRSGTLFPRCGELEDTGDVGDEYDYSPPRRDRRVSSAGAGGLAVERLESGPLRAGLRVRLELRVPAEAEVDRTGRSDEVVRLPVSFEVRLEAGSPRLVWTATLDNRARDHRLRVLFPAGCAGMIAEARADSAFGIARRPSRRPQPAAVPLEVPMSTAPLRSFLDAGDDRSGVTVFAEGLMEYEVVAGAAGEARVALTLLRCVGDLSREDLATRPGGHAGPGLRTPGAQCPGWHGFRFAMEPRAAPPPAATLYARARSFLAPPRVVGARATGRLPARLSFLRFEAEGGGTVLSACRKAGERASIVLRLFNPGLAEARVTVTSRVPLAHAFHLDFLERRQREIPVTSGRLPVRLGPYRIETIELVPENEPGRGTPLRLPREDGAS